MTTPTTYRDGLEFFEYHGNTAVERIRKRNGAVRRDWFIFDTVEEAVAFFDEQCACCGAA